MKKTLVAALLFSAVAASAQTKKPAPAKTPAKAPAPAPAPLKNLTDSASYAIGISVANFYTQQGMTQINSAIVAKAINDVLGKKTVLLDDQQANTVMMQLMNQAQENKAKGNIEAGQKFLAENGKRAGVHTTASGLQYEVLQQGTGPKPAETDTVTVNYRGMLVNGEEFDNSFKRGQPISFAVNGVIRGWTEALQLMPAGSKYKIYIPYQLGYGTNDVGTIPPGSALVFEVELLEINGKKP